MSLHHYYAYRFRHDRRLDRELDRLRSEKSKLIHIMNLCSTPFDPSTVVALEDIVDKQWNQTFKSALPVSHH